MGDTVGFRRHSFSWQANRILELGTALKYGNTERFVAHGDVKPDNILVFDTDDLRVADYGTVANLFPGTPFVQPGS